MLVCCVFGNILKRMGASVFAYYIRETHLRSSAQSLVDISSKRTLGSGVCFLESCTAPLDSTLEHSCSLFLWMKDADQTTLGTSEGRDYEASQKKTEWRLLELSTLVAQAH